MLVSPRSWAPAELRELTVHIDTGRWSETVLQAVNLAVPRGRLTALVGESGCGKSMLAAALTGRLPASAHSDGQVIINGTAVRNEPQWRQLRGHVVGHLPQEGVTAFNAVDTVGAQLRALERRHRQWSVERACRAAGYPAEVADLLPQQHSGGQIQRAALAAALLPAPEVLVVDEPTASLDTATRYRLWFVLREYADAGAAVLAITHDVPLLTVLGVADQLTFLRDGRIAAAGSVAEMSADSDPYVQGFFHDVGQ